MAVIRWIRWFVPIAAVVFGSVYVISRIAGKESGDALLGAAIVGVCVGAVLAVRFSRS